MFLSCEEGSFQNRLKRWKYCWTCDPSVGGREVNKCKAPTAISFSGWVLYCYRNSQEHRESERINARLSMPSLPLAESCRNPKQPRETKRTNARLPMPSHQLAQGSQLDIFALFYLTSVFSPPEDGTLVGPLPHGPWNHLAHRLICLNVCLPCL